MIAPLSNITGQPLDWWFAYKLPEEVGPKRNTTGFEFLYCDSAANQELELSPINMDHDSSALAQTLSQIFNPSDDVGYILWNDEIPPANDNPKPKDNGGKGHTKGVLAFSKKQNCGYYLLHSTPKFPVVGTVILPYNERKYGQTFLCIAFDSFQTANDIAELLLTQHQAQVYASRLPEINQDELLYKLATGKKCPTPDNPSIYNIITPGGIEFKLLAKNKKWSESHKDQKVGKDFWEDLVNIALNCDLTVETWRRGMVFGNIDDNSKLYTEDVLELDLKSIGLEGYLWPFTKDHAKWGISAEQNMPYVIIADINRQESQAKRGGGGLAFKNPKLWKALYAIEEIERNKVSGSHMDFINSQIG